MIDKYDDSLYSVKSFVPLNGACLPNSQSLSRRLQPISMSLLVTVISCGSEWGSERDDHRGECKYGGISYNNLSHLVVILHFICVPSLFTIKVQVNPRTLIYAAHNSMLWFSSHTIQFCRYLAQSRDDIDTWLLASITEWTENTEGYRASYRERDWKSQMTNEAAVGKQRVVMCRSRLSQWSMLLIIVCLLLFSVDTIGTTVLMCPAD